MHDNINPNQNCHNYCSMAKYCRYHKGEVGIDPEDCVMYYKLDDLLNEARMEAVEDNRRQEEEEW